MAITGFIGAGRVFSISPAVSGKSVWSLDGDGPLLLTAPGTWTITPLAPFSLEVELWGGGGAGTGHNLANVTAVGTSGADSTFASLLAGGGVRSALTGDGTGAGGTASGGDTNTNGSKGGLPPSAFIGGDGGDAGNGGSGGDGGVGFLNATSAPGGPGIAPGAGGGGAGGDGARTPRWGGGGAAYTKKTYAIGDLTPGTPLTLVVGARGVAADVSPSGFTGGHGAHGQARIT